MAKRKRTKLTPEGIEIQRVGVAIGGRHWQSDVARKIHYSKSMITKALSGIRDPGDIFFQNLRDEAIIKLSEIGECFGSNVLPNHNSKETKQAQALIKQAVKLLRLQGM